MSTISSGANDVVQQRLAKVGDRAFGDRALPVLNVCSTMCARLILRVGT